MITNGVGYVEFYMDIDHTLRMKYCLRVSSYKHDDGEIFEVMSHISLM
jgi:hypothetical protein